MFRVRQRAYPSAHRWHSHDRAAHPTAVPPEARNDDVANTVARGHLLVPLLIVALLAGCTTGSDTPSVVSPAVEEPPLAVIDGIGSIRRGTVDTNVELGLQARASSAPVELPAGVLALHDGLAVDIPSPPPGLLEIRLQLPPPPSDDAIPGVLHVADDGSQSVEPGLWNPETNQITVYADTFSDRFGGWWNPANWVEEGLRGTGSVVDFVFDHVTGRSDPPDCRDDAPNWYTVNTRELSSLHICSQTDTADARARAELLLKGNRTGMQVVSIPAIQKDYIWVQNQEDEFAREFYPAFAGVDPATHVVLVGDSAMSIGFPQPTTSVEFEMRSFLTPTIVVVNPLVSLLGLVGDSPIERAANELAAMAVVTCANGSAGWEPTRLDFSGVGDRNEFLEGVLDCALDVLADPTLAANTIDEAARILGLSEAAREAGRTRTAPALKRIMPLAERLGRVFGRAAVLTTVWDGIFDSLGEGLISGSLTGTGPTAEQVQYACPGVATQPVLPALENRWFDAIGDACGYPGQPRADIDSMTITADGEETSVGVIFAEPTTDDDTVALRISGNAASLSDQCNSVTVFAQDPAHGLSVSVFDGCGADPSNSATRDFVGSPARRDGRRLSFTIPTRFLQSGDEKFYVQAQAFTRLSPLSTTVISDNLPDDGRPPAEILIR